MRTMIKLVTTCMFVISIVACGGSAAESGAQPVVPPADAGHSDAADSGAQTVVWNCGDNGLDAAIADASPGANCFPSGHPSVWCCY